MKKISLGNNISVYPMPVVLLGAMDGDRASFMAVGWISRVNGSPPMVAIGSNNVHRTNELIRKNNAFSICYPGRALKDKVDYCGLVSSRNADKSGVFNIFKGKLGVPLIEECPLNVECRLYRTVDLPTHTVFIGEIIGSYADEACLTDGSPDVKKMDPLLLTMPDNTYWAVGESVGKAWHDGRALIKK